MKRPWLQYPMAALVLAVHIPCAHPQVVTPPKTDAPKIDAQANQEDIEVMRRLLSQLMTPHQASALLSATTQLRPDGSVLFLSATQSQAVRHGVQWLQSNPYKPATTGAYGSVWADVDNDGFPDLYVNNSTRPAPKITFEGNYLKGHGVNFTATVRPTEPVWFHPGSKALGVASCTTCHAQRMTPDASPQPPPLSAWEKTRRELIGSPPPKAPASVRIGQTCQPGNLTEAILDLLAENGHHFNQLPATENISVALTIYANRAVSTTQGTAQSSETAKGLQSKVQDLKALGELHLKQNKWNEAADVFRDAIKIFQQIPADGDAKKAERERERRSLNLKLIIALHSAGRDAEAEAWVKALAEGKGKEPAPESTTTAVSEQRVVLPAKLIITASKQLLLDVHSKKITLEQFKKSAEVEAIGFPAADKKK